MGLPRYPLNLVGGWPTIAIMLGARHIQVGNVCWLSWQALVDEYEHQEEGMTLVIKAQEISFSTTNNIHSTPINAKVSSRVGICQPNNTMGYLETTL